MKSPEALNWFVWCRVCGCSVIYKRASVWRWINPRNHCCYQADLVLDPFGDWTLVCAWGGLGTLRGNQSITGVSSRTDGLRKIEALGGRREKRGYISVTSFAGWADRIGEVFTQCQKSRHIAQTELVLE